MPLIIIYIISFSYFLKFGEYVFYYYIFAMKITKNHEYLAFFRRAIIL